MDIIVAVIIGIILGVIGTILFLRFKKKPEPTPFTETCPYKIDVAMCAQDPAPTETAPSIAIPAIQETPQSPDITTPILRFPTKPKKTIKASKKTPPNKPKKKT